MTTKFFYIGEGESIPGVPARNLTEDDWNRLVRHERQSVESSALYQAAPAAPAVPPSTVKLEPAVFKLDATIADEHPTDNKASASTRRVRK